MTHIIGLIGWTIQLDIPFYFLLLFAVIGCGLAMLMYRDKSAIARPGRIFLFALRTVSLFLLFLAAANLTTDLVTVKSQKRTVFVLVDDSKSMALSDGPNNRGKIVHDLLQSATFHDLSDQFKVIPEIFGGQILKMNDLDSLKFDQPFTDIESPLETASRLASANQASFAILITDGNYNEGGDPIDEAKNMSIPVYSIGVGDSTPPKDIAVRQIITPSLVYAEKKSIVKGIVSSLGFGGRTATAKLVEDGETVGTREIDLAQEGNVEVNFSYTPKAVGTHILSLSVSPLKGEFDLRNNMALTSVDVLKGKFSVLLIAGEPASDVAFILRNIQLPEDFDVKELIQKNGDNFYDPAATAPPNDSSGVNEILSTKLDAILLYDFPNSQSSGTLRRVAEVLNSTGAPYVYLAGKNFFPEKVSRLPRLPFAMTDYSSAPPGGEFQVGISPAGTPGIMAGLQPVCALLSENAGLIPPLYYQRIDCVPSYSAATLAFPVINGAKMSSPVFLVSENARSAAFLAYGLWRIQLMSPLSGLKGDFLQEFLTTLIRNLIESGKQRLLTVSTDRRNYDPSQTINFFSLLVNQTGAPIDNADVELSVRDEGSNRVARNLQLISGGNGSYAGSLDGLGEGKYSFHAQAKSGAALLGSDSGIIVVESLNTEFVQTSMNAPLLERLSAITGGRFLTPSEFIGNGITIKPEWKEPAIVTDETKSEALSLLPILVCVVVLLAVEWTMRKVWGLP